MKENILQALFATVCGAIVAYLNILLVPFAVMIAVMIIDYITGMAQAYISHTLNSRVGVTGIIKKVGYICSRSGRYCCRLSHQLGTCQLRNRPAD